MYHHVAGEWGFIEAPPSSNSQVSHLELQVSHSTLESNPKSLCFNKVLHQWFLTLWHPFNKQFKYLFKNPEMAEKLQWSRSLTGRYQIDKQMLRIVWEMEKPKNLYARSMDMNWGVWLLERRGVPGGGEQRGKNWGNCNSIINKIYFKKWQSSQNKNKTKKGSLFFYLDKIFTTE